MAALQRKTFVLLLSQHRTFLWLFSSFAGTPLSIALAMSIVLLYRRWLNSKVKYFHTKTSNQNSRRALTYAVCTRSLIFRYLFYQPCLILPVVTSVIRSLKREPLGHWTNHWASRHPHLRQPSVKFSDENGKLFEAPEVREIPKALHADYLKWLSVLLERVNGSLVPDYPGKLIQCTNTFLVKLQNIALCFLCGCSPRVIDSTDQLASCGVSAYQQL